MVTDVQRPKGIKNNWDWGNLDRCFTIHHDIAGGEAAEMVFVIRAGACVQDIHVDKVIVSLENAPGGGKTITVAVSDGTSTMTVTVAEANTYGTTIVNNFDLNVSAEDLTITLTATAGTTAGCATIVVFYHDVAIP